MLISVKVEIAILRSSCLFLQRACTHAVHGRLRASDYKRLRLAAARRVDRQTAQQFLMGRRLKASLKNNRPLLNLTVEMMLSAVTTLLAVITLLADIILHRQ